MCRGGYACPRFAQGTTVCGSVCLVREAHFICQLLGNGIRLSEESPRYDILSIPFERVVNSLVKRKKWGESSRV